MSTPVKQISTPQSSNNTSSGVFSTFTQGTMAACSAQLLSLAELFTKITIDYNHQMVEGLEEQNKAAIATQHACEKEGENEAASMIAQGVSQVVSGLCTFGVGSIACRAETKAQPKIDEYNTKINNAEGYRTACQERLAQSPPTNITTLEQQSSTTNDRLNQLKSPGHDFGQDPISTEDKKFIACADVEKDIQNENGISKNVDQYIKNQQSQKEMLEQKLNRQSQQWHTYGQAFSNMANGTGTSIAANFKQQSADWQGKQTLGNNALQNAQKVVENASSQAQATQQQLSSIYSAMEQVNQANSYR